VPRVQSPRLLFHYAVLTATTTEVIRKPIHMTIHLTENLKAELEQTAHHCSVPPEKLASLFVEDGLRSYRDSRDELRDSIDAEDS